MLLFAWIQDSYNVYEKALLEVVGTSYIQSFVDNKDYREATLAFLRAAKEMDT